MGMGFYDLENCFSVILSVPMYGAILVLLKNKIAISMLKNAINIIKIKFSFKRIQDFYVKKTLSSNELKAIHSLELEALTVIDQICRRHSIKYTLIDGSLLGAIRHNGFIPWDDDVDIAMLRDDLEKFKLICKTELPSKYFYQDMSTDPEYLYLFDKIRINNTLFKESYLAEYNINHGVFIDIFPVDNVSDNKKKLKTI